MGTNELKEIKRLISKVHSNNSVPLEVTLDWLEDLQIYIDELVEGTEQDISNRDASLESND